MTRARSRSTHSHERLSGIGALVDQFRRRVSVRCPVHFVLHHGEKLLRRHRVRRVIHARRVDVQNLLVKPPFRRADVPDALQQFVKIIHLPIVRRVFQPLIIHRETFHEVFPQPLRCPDAELRAARRRLAAWAASSARISFTRWANSFCNGSGGTGI